LSKLNLFISLFL